MLTQIILSTLYGHLSLLERCTETDFYYYPQSQPYVHVLSQSLTISSNICPYKQPSPQMSAPIPYYLCNHLS